MIHQKRGGMLRGLRIKREREEYVGILISKFVIHLTWGGGYFPMS
jgi:hypothetical protein